jgi:uncharacterized protein DUF4389
VSTTYDVTYEETRNRLTVAFRYILAIPHLIVAGLWAYLAEFLAVIQWFIVLFTGKHNEGIWKMQESWLGYYGRVLGYTNILYDEYPAFGTSPGNVPVTSSITYEEDANRLTNALRMFWIIPAAIIGLVVGIGGAILAVVSWFAIIITGKHPRGMWEFMLKVVNYVVQFEAYAFLMTDEYPKFGGPTTATAVSPNTFAPPPAT